MSDSEKDLMIATLNKRLSALEAEVSALKAASPGIPEDVLVAISAAVSAYLGNDGSVQAVRFTPSPTWNSQGRKALQNHSIR
ncbi:hypothetical protein [Propionibacterium australiense]|uniref:Uncharacterized protein n=1 Tax=Propionibacterium australiense TaxID=119981 RepID=A0A383S6E7_9ACTN|nr:hypothetical protein [Propionibacterium australiense]RLP10071.1 hypothetical protein D9T14_05935 [Propionibacterium australiense]RLP11355.1 hypothetical protein D7U36_04375 [Propionibacterium australiense]SYZ32994.1 Hypothetical protein PROPAUS_0905 [Propionibacterium australiense]VEH92281.1 Methylmalonyl-CoA carboxyltransferase 12S subunit [Propionibacterium australiense]